MLNIPTHPAPEFSVDDWCAANLDEISATLEQCEAIEERHAGKPFWAAEALAHQVRCLLEQIGEARAKWRARHPSAEQVAEWKAESMAQHLEYERSL